MGRVNFGRGLLGADNHLAPGNRTRDPKFTAAGDANFDTNMVIILAALLFTLIGALGLNSIVRCALSCYRRLPADTPEHSSSRLARTGVKKRVLRQIPVAVYGSGEADFRATECPICLAEFADGEKVRVLPKCNHGFHVRCIDTWLVSHSSCPNCRHSLLERPGVHAAEAHPAAGGTVSSNRGSVVVMVEETN